MVTDREQLNKSPAVFGTGTSVLFGLAILFPVLLWISATVVQTLGSAAGGSVFSMNMVRMIILVLALGVPVSLPWFAGNPSWVDTLCGPLMVVLIPLPLMTVLWLTGDARFMILLAPWAAVALFMLMLATGLRLLSALIRDFQTLALTHTAITVVVVGMAWALRNEWLAWLGL